MTSRSAYRTIFAPNLFADQLAVITGGGSGIGRCTAHELSALGARVVLTGRKQDKLDRTAAELREDGGTVDTIAFDIRKEDDVKAAIGSIIEKHGPIHHLVNNAGGQFPAPLAAINQKGFETVVRTNLVGGFLVAREAYNQSFQKHGGSVVNIVADMWNGMPGMGHSGAARAGMINFTKTAAVEWAYHGVRVNAVAPGWIASSGMDTYDATITSMLPTMEKAIPLKRLGTESEISAAIVFLLSPGAAFITGTTLSVDGGAPLHPHHWPMHDHDRSEPFHGFHRHVEPEAIRRMREAKAETLDKKGDESS